MLPEDIDSLFRNQLDGHQSAPAHDLWARLQAQLPATPEATDGAPSAPEGQHLDELFRTHLSQHRTQPPRELWERLEDEHLRPRKRRTAAWWPLALAASVALFLLVGGGLLWPGWRQGTAGIAGVNRKSNPSTEHTAASQIEANPAAKAPVAAIPATDIEKVKKNIALQATAPDRLSSSAPEGPGTAPRRPAARPGQSVQKASTYATLAPERVRQSGPAAASRSTPASHQSTTGVAPMAAGNNQPVVAQHLPAPAPAAEAEVIEVEVRRGGSPAVAAVAAPAPTPEVAEAALAAPGLSGQLGGLFHHAKGAVRLAKSGLAVAQNIPDNLTVQAHVGHRTLSKTIEL